MWTESAADIICNGPGPVDILQGQMFYKGVHTDDRNDTGQGTDRCYLSKGSGRRDKKRTDNAAGGTMCQGSSREAAAYCGKSAEGFSDSAAFDRCEEKEGY